MFKKIISVLFIAVMLLTCGSCVKLTKLVDVTEDVPVPTNIVFLGDSIAAGYGLEGYTGSDLYNCRSYANILAEKYGSELPEDCPHTMVNKAVSGMTSAELLESIRSGELDDVLGSSDAVVVSIGGNDLLSVIFRIMGKLGYNFDTGKVDITDAKLLSAALDLIDFKSDIDKALDGFRDNLKETAAELKARAGGRIFVQTLYDPLEYFDIKMLSELTDDKIGRFNDIVAACSVDGDDVIYTTVDVAGAFDGRCGDLTNISGFDIHPNAKGHEIIADKVDTAVRKYTYSYTKAVEVTDEDAVRSLIIICVASGAAVLAVIIAVIVVIVRKKKKN